jgi:hypothetical protein
MSDIQQHLSLKGSPTLALQERQEAFQAAETAALINSSQIKLDQTRTKERTFFEEFSLWSASHFHRDCRLFLRSPSFPIFGWIRKM